MKRSTRFIVALLVTVGALAITYHVVNQAPSRELAADAQMQEVIASGGCLQCYSGSPDLPFYADWLVAGGMVQKGVEQGYRTFDMTKMVETLKVGKPVGKMTLAKVERVIMDGTMPKHAYYMVHWRADVTDAKKEMVMAWARQHRLAHYTNGLASAGFVNKPVRPIANSIPVDMRKMILGDMLYHDTRLSASSAIPCVSCHGLNTEGVDNRQYSEGVDGQFGGVNTPTVYNVTYNFVQFWDGRIGTLTEQAAGPPLNPVEMAYQSFDEIIAKLGQDTNFTKAFLTVYPDGYPEKNITDAIKEFEETLLTPNSRFDLCLEGEKTAIDDIELAEHELFKKYDCATCHVGETLGGQSYELMGMKRDYFADRGVELTEEGNERFKQTQNDHDKHRFRVPGLGSITLTAPYFHNGSVKVMKETVNYMAEYQVDKNLPEDELNKIVAFLETLTGEYKGKPLTNDNQGKAL